MKRLVLAATAALLFASPLATTAAFADQPQQERRNDDRGGDRNDDRGGDRNDRDGDRNDRHDDRAGRDDRGDRNYDRNWQSINQRQNMLENRIQAGIRNGRLNRNEAVNLRSEFRQIAQVEARYRRNGLSTTERRDLDRRFDRLTSRLQFALNDNNRRRG